MHVCSCGKLYKRLKAFQEHRALCEMIRDNRTDIVDDMSTPSVRELWLVLKILITKNEKLEKRVKELNVLANRERKKIRVRNEREAVRRREAERTI